MLKTALLFGAIVLALAGVATLAAGHGSSTAVALGAGLLGVSGVLATAFVFYLVGESEDRDRARHPHG